MKGVYQIWKFQVGMSQGHYFDIFRGGHNQHLYGDEGILDVERDKKTCTSRGIGDL